MSAAVGINSAGEALRRALRWWGEGLAMALPAWALAAVLGDRRCVHLEVDEAGELRARLTSMPFASKAIDEAAFADDPSGAGKAALKTIRAAARSRPVVFTPPAEHVLTQKVMVPEAALENLQQAVSFGISTWTPFEADMLVYHADVVERRGEQARIRIRMIPRKTLEPYLIAAAEAETPIRLVAFDQSLQACAEISQSSKRPTQKIDLALLASVILLGCALLGTLHFRWASELDRLDVGIRAELAQQAKQRAIEQKLAQLDERRRTVIAKRAREPRLAEILARIGNAMPETTDVSEFSWTGAQGRIAIGRDAATEVRARLGDVGIASPGTPLKIGNETVAIELSLKKAAP